MTDGTESFKGCSYPRICVFKALKTLEVKEMLGYSENMKDEMRKYKVQTKD